MVKNEIFVKIKVNGEEMWKIMSKFERMKHEVRLSKVWVLKWLEYEGNKARKEKFEGDLE